jgi:hypothetical protein
VPVCVEHTFYPICIYFQVLVATLLRKRGIAYLNYSEDELAEEWQAVANLPAPGAE